MTPRPDPPPAARSREIRRDDPSYPALLQEIEDPPSSLWVRGDASLLGATTAAVVGARRATALGLEMGERLGAGLAAAGIVVVSGCAIGIDAAAHRGALEVGGSTIAVLAGGLDVAVPPSNRGLASRIVREGGCIACEHPDGVPVGRWSFPRRNRIIAGLARVVVVVEAAERSGALITARLALAAGREVLAVPGHPLQEACAGSNALLRDGARPVLDASDVLAELAGLPRVDVASPPERRSIAPPYDPACDRVGLRARVHASLGKSPCTPESLAVALGLPLGSVLGALTELELVGLARARPGQSYSLPVERSRPADA